MAVPNDPEDDRNLMRIRGLQTRIDNLQTLLDELPMQIGARLLALTVLGLLTATWMWPEIKEDVDVRYVVRAYHSGFGVFTAPWNTEQHTLALISRLALVIYVLAAIALLALSPQLKAHTIVAGVGVASLLVILLMKPEPFGDIDDPSIIYRWSIAPYFALLCWLGLLAAGLMMRHRSD